MIQKAYKKCVRITAHTFYMPYFIFYNDVFFNVIFRLGKFCGDHTILYAASKETKQASKTKMATDFLT
ncbi:MAG: hypothetical protein JG777_65 [Clostridia bacterium]|jgi:hypothetical protein|nr:hypothetical protein [Clostridia bacterium]